MRSMPRPRASLATGRLFAASAGFTLIEIILVVVIILTLVGLVGPRIAGRGKETKISTTKITIGGLATALQEFEIKAGRYPTTEEGLLALVKMPSGLDKDDWSGPYLNKGSVPTDAWKGPFTYKCPSEHGGNYDISSKGPDQQAGSADDITNFEDAEKK